MEARLISSPAASSRSLAPSAKANGCAAASCSSGWIKPWRRRLPVFEGNWSCSSKCLQTLVRAAIEREAGDSEAASLPARHRVPLGLVLLAQGWITHPQLQVALNAQRASGRGRIGDWLTQSCGLEEDRITRGLGVQWGCPILSTEGFLPRSMALVMPKRFIAEFGLIPLRLTTTKTLQLAFEDKLDAPLTAALQQMTGFTVEAGLLQAEEFASARKSLLEAAAIPIHMGLTQDAASLTEILVSLIEKMQPAAARLVRVHKYYWLRFWLSDATKPGSLPTQVQGLEDHVFMVH